MSLKDIKIELIGMAGAFGANLNEATLAWYERAFQGNDPQRVLAALRVYAKTTKIQKMPTPAQILEIINPTINTAGQAREAAARLIQAVRKFGYTNPDGAQAFVGPLGWRVVERLGGWTYICENLGTRLAQDTFYAQARDLAMATVERASMGIDNEAPQINNAPLKEVLNSMVKKIE